MALGYTEAELCERGSGYQFIHAADMLHCAENHMRRKLQCFLTLSCTGWIEPIPVTLHMHVAAPYLNVEHI